MQTPPPSTRYYKHTLGQHVCTTNKQVEALTAAAQQQAAYVAHITHHLPQHLPTLPGTRTNTPMLHTPSSTTESQPTQPSNVLQPRTTNVQQPKPAPAAKPVGRTLPRRFVTQAELAGLSSYVRGRLTQDKVNAALDEVCRWGWYSRGETCGCVHVHRAGLQRGMQGTWPPHGRAGVGVPTASCSTCTCTRYM